MPARSKVMNHRSAVASLVKETRKTGSIDLGSVFVKQRTLSRDGGSVESAEASVGGLDEGTPPLPVEPGPVATAAVHMVPVRTTIAESPLMDSDPTAMFLASPDGGFPAVIASSTFRSGGDTNVTARA